MADETFEPSESEGEIEQTQAESVPEAEAESTAEAASETEPATACEGPAVHEADEPAATEAESTSSTQMPDTAPAPEAEDNAPSAKRPGKADPRTKKIAIAAVGVIAVAGLGMALLGGGKTQVVSKVTVETEYESGTAEFELEYNKDGSLASFSGEDFDLRDLETVFTYDKGNLVEYVDTVDMDETSAKYEYENGRLVKITTIDDWGDRTVSKGTYEGDNLVKIATDNDADGKSTETLKYDGDKIVSVREVEENGDTNTHKYAYDDEGRITLVKSTMVNDDDETVTNIKTAYDEEGRVESRTIEFMELITSKYRFTYDDEGRLTKEVLITEYESSYIDDRKEVTEYEYNDKGQLVRMSGVDDEDTRTTETYEWDEKGNLATRTVNVDGTTTVYTYEYTSVKKTDASDRYRPDVKTAAIAPEPNFFSVYQPSVDNLVDDAVGSFVED